MCYLRLRDKVWALDRPYIMGIINVTPDSFSDGGEADTPEKALSRAEKLLSEGADILDIGAVSTRPGAPEVPEEEEYRRLLPALRAIRKAFPDVPISVDTFRGGIARAALEEGADLINDVSGGAWDPTLWPVIAQYQVPYILMHIQGTPQTMQINPTYQNLLQEVWLYFVEKLQQLAQIGIHDVIIDPGFGFGKTLKHNYQLLRNLRIFRRLGRPILVGISRKSMLWRVLEVSPKETLWASTALHWQALLAGARLFRVHDPLPLRHVFKIWEVWSSSP
jgi:dihydropteroate synthase